jgi:hypothetical protein
MRQRKIYFASIQAKVIESNKMEEMREYVALRQVQVEQWRKKEEELALEQKKKQMYGTIHHLIGTKNVPGVYSVPPITLAPITRASSPYKRPATAKSRPMTAMSRPTTAVASTRPPTAHSKCNRPKSAISIPSRPTTACSNGTTWEPITESLILHYSDIKSWMSQKKVYKKMPPTNVDRRKRAQGPFLVFHDNLAKIHPGSTLFLVIFAIYF